jgi:Ser/Thr protein kinase RdoA (MazF antagonist)
MEKQMQREEITQICDRDVLQTAARLFGTRKGALKMFPDYEGAANLVYEYDSDGTALILRISYTQERSLQQIQAELNYVCYLYENGARVSRPVPSKNGIFVETVPSAGVDFHVVSFIKGKGMRVPDNDYRYRVDAPIEEYFQNWGQTLGQMHRLAKDFQPEDKHITRPEWFELHKSRLAVETLVPARYPVIRDRIQSLFSKLRSLPRDRDSFGLIHGDFNDGNFTVDYSNGDITVFDFDDSCYFWFMYELASAWEGGIGRVMFQSINERISFMDHYMDQVLEGYQRENALSADWFALLPLFIQLIQVEEFLHYVRYIDQPNNEFQGGLNYKIRCIENEIPYMGFFDRIYSPEKPFSL